MLIVLVALCLFAVAHGFARPFGSRAAVAGCRLKADPSIVMHMSEGEKDVEPKDEQAVTDLNLEEMFDVFDAADKGETLESMADKESSPVEVSEKVAFPNFKDPQVSSCYICLKEGVLFL